MKVLPTLFKKWFWVVRVMIVWFGSIAVFADSPAPATEKFVFSDKQKYLAHVIPTKDGYKTVREKAWLIVSSVAAGATNELWRTAFVNAVSPQSVFLTDDAQHVQQDGVIF